MKYVYHGKLQEIQRYGHFNFISKVQSFLMGLYLNKVAKLVKLYNWVKGLNQPFFDTKTESYDFWGHRAQCVELKSRWQVCVHASTWPESYFQAKFWIFFLYSKHQILTKICSEAYLKHTQRNFYQKSERIQFFMTISSIMFKIGFWAYASQDLVLEISKIVQNFDYKHISWHALAWTQNCHLNFNSTHCAEVTVAYTKRAQSA